MSALPLRQNPDRRFFTCAAIGVALIVFAGFAKSYYLKAFFENEALPLLLHVHGLVMTSWIVLFFTQTYLIASHRVDLHRRLGIFGCVLAALIVAIGTCTAIHAAAGAVLNPPTHPRFFLIVLGFDDVILLLFAILFSAAIALRRRSDYRKRLMLLATLTLLGPAIDRLPLDAPVVAVVLTDLCLLICVAIDTYRNRRLHPAFGWGAPAIIVSFLLAYALVLTPAWMRFATWLVS